MRYADFYECDICNGNSVGVSLFIQGCPFHCKGCFNPETWDFDGGKEWNKRTWNKFMNLVDRDYIHRVSFLGGSPLCDENLKDVYNIIAKIKRAYPDKEIWVYTGMVFEDIIKHYPKEDNFDFSLKAPTKEEARAMLLDHIDVLVDGPFEYDKRDLTLAFCGSTNQRIIDVKKTLSNANKEIVLWNNETD